MVLKTFSFTIFDSFSLSESEMKKTPKTQKEILPQKHKDPNIPTQTIIPPGKSSKEGHFSDYFMSEKLIIAIVCVTYILKLFDIAVNLN